MTVDDARASIRMYQAESYLADLVAWANGDEERFGRMVLDGGSSCNASPQRWARFILNIATEDYVVVRYRDRLAEMIVWLSQRGLGE